MRFYVSQVHSLVGVTVEDAPYEIDYRRTEVDWKVYVDFENSLIGLVLI